MWSVVIVFGFDVRFNLRMVVVIEVLFVKNELFMLWSLVIVVGVVVLSVCVVFGLLFRLNVKDVEEMFVIVNVLLYVDGDMFVMVYCVFVLVVSEIVLLIIIVMMFDDY